MLLQRVRGESRARVWKGAAVSLASRQVGPSVPFPRSPPATRTEGSPDVLWFPESFAQSRWSGGDSPKLAFPAFPFVKRGSLVVSDSLYLPGQSDGVFPSSHGWG